MRYQDFIASKRVEAPAVGRGPDGALNEHLFDFQREIVEWALHRGRAAVFADCGLGKTLMQLSWADQVTGLTGGRVLIFAPLAVSDQTAREAARFGIRAAYAATPADVGDSRIVITNYERLDRFDVSSFAGVVLDESSILKSFMGKAKRRLIEACRPVHWRLACTATPAPNDHMELGNHADWLGVMSSGDMLARWFINDTSQFGTYRLKGHAVESFWDWVASWAVCVGRPSDMGYPDDGYALPELTLKSHVIDVDLLEDRGDSLFRIPDMSATSVHREKRKTVGDRAAKVAELVAAEPDEPWLVWCETDYEADALKRAMPEAVEVRGSATMAKKVEAARQFVDGNLRVLVSKPKIFGWGLNFQHCARVAFVGATFSYELFYQAVRRVWRFGQTRPVVVHVVMAQTEARIWEILTSKRDDHDEMRAQMSAAVRRRKARESRVGLYQPEVEMMVPKWMQSERRVER